jgi:hypothetical protein
LLHEYILHKLYLHPQCNLFFSFSFWLSQHVSAVHGHRQVFYIHGATTSRHKQGGYMITTPIFRELHTHKHLCRCTRNPNKENLHNSVWIKRRQPPSKILKKF